MNSVETSSRGRSCLTVLEHSQVSRTRKKALQEGATAKDSPKSERFQRFPDHKPRPTCFIQTDIQPDLEQGDYSSQGAISQEGFCQDVWWDEPLMMKT